MRICFIEDTRLRGGTQIWVAEATRHLLAAGVDVTILAPEGGYNALEGAEAGARVVGYDEVAVIEQGLQQRAIWNEALRDADVAVCTVHPPREGFHCAVFAARCIAEAGLSTVLAPKTGTIVPDYERRFYLPDLDVRSHVIAITGFTRRHLIEAYGLPDEGVTLQYQGTDVARFRPDAARRAEALERYPRPEGAALVFGIFGAIEPRKGHAALLEALERADLPDAHVLVIGEGPSEAEVRAEAEARGLSDRVAFHPFTSEPEYAFEAIDALLLPSLRKEGLPNVILEGMAMGLPVIASRLAGVPEVIEDGVTGRLVEPGDVAGLAEALRGLAADLEAARAMGARGQARVRAEHDKAGCFDAFLELYRGLARR